MKDFSIACIRCGECMKVCLTGGLQPTILEVNPVSAIRVYTQGEKRIKLKPGEKWLEANPNKTTTESDKYYEKPQGQPESDPYNNSP